ncbi:MAG: 1-deoxy-D-xylulose-5-phosphate synthase N-terminal domain-containing protein, partial [Sedimentisphaerales bacterium]
MQNLSSEEQHQESGVKRRVEAIRPVGAGLPAEIKGVSGADVDWQGYPLLAGINGVGDLKGLSVAQLQQLADEIRQFIIETVGRTGGHLASSLGVVDITIALHYVFDFERDKLVWDVGHQCYAHKIITGRKEEFKNLRRAGGVSGFPNPEESPYDQFAVGHAGTSIGTAIGLALGETKQGKQDKIVAFVGDG